MRTPARLSLSLLLMPALAAASEPLQLNDLEYFESTGVNVLVFSNWYNGLFDDSKMSGVELIHHGVRTVTNGDVRLHATPEQWDAIPEFAGRAVERERGAIQANLKYAQYAFDYSIRVEARGDAVDIAVILPAALPPELEGIAGFNLEFLPAVYFGKSFIMDDRYGTLPLYPTGPKEQNGIMAPQPLAAGKRLVMAPEDPERTLTITSAADMLLFDGRSKAQNGWFVLRGLLPGGRTGRVLEWSLSASSIEGWVRAPVIGHSQVGYLPLQKKTAVIERDPRDTAEAEARLYRVGADGRAELKIQAMPTPWGRYLRYDYRTFDFSAVTEAGIYYIEYRGQQTAAFRIGDDVYEDIWQPTLDIFLPVQMDHMTVNEAYRVWHGASHQDDALQAPVDHAHFDLYAQGPTTDTPFRPGEHIPGLNVGGWYDAGDYDIRTQSQYAVVNTLVDVWETFHLERDNTLVDYARKYVDLHVPDGKPDLLQQIEHGTLALLAQHRAVGHAIPGIVEPSLEQYTHLGDGVTKTDNLVYDPALGALESDGYRSGLADDRWAFTSRSSALEFGSIAALAAASRALKGYNDALASESLDIAIAAWDEEQSRPPIDFRHGNTTGGPLAVEELKAALELLVATGERRYTERFLHHMAELEAGFAQLAGLAVRALPYLGDDYRAAIERLAEVHRKRLDDLARQNPFGVPVTEGGWAGNGTVIGAAMANYYLHRAFPATIGHEDVLRGLNYIFGTHPGSNLSFVSAVGARSKQVAYGMNRADFSFIAGGIVPGVLLLKPDFPENKEDWPFLWGENEYVVTLGASYLFLANAARALASRSP